MATQVFTTLDSTQSEAKRQLQTQRFTELEMIVARMQTNGYGRFKRTFYSPRNGLYLTMVVPEKLVVCTPTILTHATAVGLVSVLVQAGYRDIGIKWINDLYVHQRKVAGILIEQEVVHGECYYLIGIGLNLNTQSIPNDLVAKMATLNSSTDAYTDPLQLLSSLNETLLSLFQCPDELILHHYRQASMVIGREITAEMGQETITGTAIGIDDNGGLIMHTQNGQRHVTTGEIVRIHFSET